MFTDLESVQEALPDLKVCAVKGCALDIQVEEIVEGEASKNPDGMEGEEELKWIEVLTEVLISFLLKENQNYRK